MVACVNAAPFEYVETMAVVPSTGCENCMHTVTASDNFCAVDAACTKSICGMIDSQDDDAAAT